MNREKKREAIRQADQSLRFRIGISFEDAQLSCQWWALADHSEMGRDEADRMQPALRRLQRLWNQQRRARMDRYRCDLPDFIRAS
ncbi:MAG: hypothetical protein SYC29_12265 [Planctomycetota bacterium]|nr:hypothetical protein [Planctomycetota bacterium]